MKGVRWISCGERRVSAAKPWIAAARRRFGLPHKGLRRSCAHSAIRRKSGVQPPHSKGCRHARAAFLPIRADSLFISHCGPLSTPASARRGKSRPPSPAGCHRAGRAKRSKPLTSFDRISGNPTRCAHAPRRHSPRPSGSTTRAAPRRNPAAGSSSARCPPRAAAGT